MLLKTSSNCVLRIWYPSKTNNKETIFKTQKLTIIELAITIKSKMERTKEILIKTILLTTNWYLSSIM